MANPKLTNAKPFNFHLIAGTDDGVLTAGNQISDVTQTTYNDDGSINVLKTVQDTLDETRESVADKQDKIDSENMLSSDLVDDTDKTHKFVTSEEKSTWNGKYTKPSTGIPETDLTLLAQEKIARAENAATTQQLADGLSGKQDTLSAGTGITLTAHTETPGIIVIAAPNSLSDTELKWLKSKVFEDYFTGVITPVTGTKSIFDITVGTESKVVFTLTTKFDGTLVDLNPQPSGWDKVDGTTGQYTKTITFDQSAIDQFIAASGDVECHVSTLSSLSKTIAGNTVTVVKPAYIWPSTEEIPTVEQIQNAIINDSTVAHYGDSASLTGTVVVNDCSGKYVHFIVPIYESCTFGSTPAMKEGTVAITNLTVPETPTGTAKPIGRYKYYTTAAQQTEQSVTFTIS